MMKSLVPALALLAACGGGSTLPAARFANAPVATIVDDRRDTPEPKPRPFYPDLWFFDRATRSYFVRGLELPRHLRAQGVNALDEVPDSTWFTNRIGTQQLTPEQVGNGPLTHHPEQHKPWTIQSTKIGGTTVGFIIKDAAGVKYLLKFDAKGSPPEMETGIHVTSNRFMWAYGYNVAEDQILYIKKEDLKIADDAKVKDNLGHTTGKLDQAGVDKVLAEVRFENDGQLRTLVSRWIDGKTIGGHADEGTRGDDPNDKIPHELRRDTRGLRAIATWLDAVDITEGQYVDAWVEDPAVKGRHYIIHYAIDFGKNMGAMGDIDHDWWRGHTYRVDWSMMFYQLATFGLTPRWWQHREGPTDVRGVPSLFDVRSLEPDNFHPDSQGYIAVRDADKFDMFWGAKILAGFTREQIQAAVDAGKFTDPRAPKYLVDTLVARQDKLVRYWFKKVNPLDRFAMDKDQLCFDDLAMVKGYAPASGTSYRIAAFDFSGKALAPATVTTAVASHTCAAGLPAGTEKDAYTIYRIDTIRDDYTGTTFVHVARDPQAGTSRVIGLWRE